MLTEVKNQFRITLLSIKYAFIRELLNKTTFITNVLFMVLNNACMIVQWIILYSLKDNFGGYSFEQILLLWGLASGTYGFSHFFFKEAYNLSEIINSGKLDVYLVQPKNVLLSAITCNVKTSALGDMLYGIIMLFVYGINLQNLCLFITFCITGGFILTSFAIILGSLSFWFNKTETIVETGNSLMVNFATYPDGIFKGIVKILLFTLIPVGLANYLPVKIITVFNFKLFLLVILFTIFMVVLAFVVFNIGLKRYSSTNLMNARV